MKNQFWEIDVINYNYYNNIIIIIFHYKNFLFIHYNNVTLFI